MKLKLILTIAFFMIVVGGSLFIKPAYQHSVGLEPTSTVDRTGQLQYETLSAQVVPSSGIELAVNWGDTGYRLVEAGAIDLEQFDALYGGLTDEQWRILQGNDVDNITLTQDNIRFWTNVLWALGLTQQTKVLTDGPMNHQSDFPLGNYASTGGWTIGTIPAVDLYNSTQIVTLTTEQDELVYQVAQHIYRPCCGNDTAFPDCNHGMAVLGLLALMASQDATEAELYDAALVFNSYAFTQNYISVAAYFAMQDVDWDEIDASRILGAEFSSARGNQSVVAEVGPIPGTPGQSNSCST